MDAKRPLVDAVEGVLSQLESGEPTVFSKDLMASFAAIVRHCTDYDPEGIVGSSEFVKAVVASFWCGWHARGAAHDEAELRKMLAE